LKSERRSASITIFIKQIRTFLPIRNTAVLWSQPNCDVIMSIFEKNTINCKVLDILNPQKVLYMVLRILWHENHLAKCIYMNYFWFGFPRIKIFAWWKYCSPITFNLYGILYESSFIFQNIQSLYNTFCPINCLQIKCFLKLKNIFWLYQKCYCIIATNIWTVTFAAIPFIPSCIMSYNE
jgi:hypothetical protein